MSNEKPRSGDVILFMDVESLPVERDNPLWLRLRESLEQSDEELDSDYEARVEKVRLKTSLMGVLGRPWMIGWALGADDPVIHRSDGRPESEEELLRAFWSSLKEVLLEKGGGSIKRPWWIGHNISGFDIPFLQARCLHHGLPDLARVLSPLQAKPWERRVLDTMSLWPRTSGDRWAFKDQGLRGTSKLDTLCSFMGVKEQTGVMGKDVYQAWLDGESDRVAEHLRLDVIQVREIFKKLWPLL